MTLMYVRTGKKYFHRQTFPHAPYRSDTGFLHTHPGFPLDCNECLWLVPGTGEIS